MPQKSYIPFFAGLFAVLLSLIGGTAGIPGTAYAAAENPPSLLITEVMIHSPETGAPYRYIELYNNSGRSIDLTKRKLLYYWPGVASNPWQNTSADTYDLIADGRTTDTYIHPYSTKIVWLLTDETKTVADFNIAYNAHLTEDQFVYTKGNGFNYTAQRYMAIVSPPYDKVNDRITFVRYNADAGTGTCTAGINCDFVQGESVDYYFPEQFDTTSREMTRKTPQSLHQAPTPGTLKSGQVPTPPGKLLITEMVIHSSGTGTPYRYIELYNNSAQAIDLSQQKLLYYWNVSAKPWLSPGVDTYSIVSAGRATDMFIQPYSTKIVWLLSDASKTTADFNANYHTSLPESQFAYIQGSGFSYTAQRYMAVVGSPYNQVNDRHSFVRYNADAGTGSCTAGVNCDFVQGEGVNYYAPASFDTESREMVRKTSGTTHQTPTPGTVKAGQVPPRPPTQTEPADMVVTDSPNYAKYFSMSTAHFIVPGLTEDYVPQGICYVPSKNWMIVVSYRSDGGPSLLSVIDFTSGNLIKSVRLFTDPLTPYTGHAGGIAAGVSHGWIASVNGIDQFDIKDIEHAVNMDTLILTDHIKTESRADYMTIDNGVLWVGEHARYTYPVTDTTHHLQNRDNREYSAWVSGYRLAAGEAVVTSRVYAATGAVIPDYILAVPDEVQGMAIDGNRIVLSKSYGSRTSDLLVYQVNLADPPHTTTAKFGATATPVWFLDGENQLYNLMAPPMAEGMFVRGGNLYTVFESGATPYRTASGMYAVDHVYATNTASLFSATAPPRVVPGDLQITEAVISSTGVNQPYRYIELYNNSNQPIDLTDHRIYYYWGNQYAKPWEYDVGEYLVYSAGRTTDMTIEPHSTKIVWFLSDETKTVSDFNAAYGTSLTADQFVYIKGGAFSATTQRFLAIVGPAGDKDVDRYTFVRYNTGAGTGNCTAGVNCDFQSGESIVYFYPSSLNEVSRELDRKVPESLHQPPTPGTVLPGQVRPLP
ncbi:lamin tail domain-containing protein [Paenibacillus thalictri]|uniref:Lamin tail domain-containing protein n=1 Tax=Paenibacillus thalictri TaxID=2527873 RepID=A0A4Q9DZ63_9BACL|nr:lamin tail domain-containing protein [Paenibacillus thalictri]TBL80551.1 lamin tail domain-containing protein [Paenibacillus thalictri]